METGVYWTFDQPEEVQKRTVKEAGRSRFDFQQLARGNGDGENSVSYDRNDGTETSWKRRRTSAESVY